MEDELMCVEDGELLFNLLLLFHVLRTLIKYGQNVRWNEEAKELSSHHHLLIEFYQFLVQLFFSSATQKKKLFQLIFFYFMLKLFFLC